MVESMDLTTRTAVGLLLLLIGIAQISPGHAVAAGEEKMSAVRTLVTKIKSEPAKAERYRLGEQLIELVDHMAQSDRNVLGSDVIDDVASLLGSDDEVIRSFSAKTLGQIGPPALRSVGSLLKALREGRSESRKIYRATSSNATDATIDALYRLGVCVFRVEDYDRTVCDYLLQ
jgi:hypothetical protein